MVDEESNLNDLKRRKKVWNALSEFYLDTSLRASDFERIAAVFKQSVYSIEEIKLIDLYEVFPLLQANLLSVAGEWAGFDEDWLFEHCERNYRKRRNWLHRMRCRIRNRNYFWMRKRYWEAVEKLMCARGDSNPHTT